MNAFCPTEIRDQSGAVKDYHHVDSHEQVNGKRKAENQQQDSKKSKSEGNICVFFLYFLLIQIYATATASDQFPINWHFTELLLKTRVEQVNQVAQGKIFVAYRHELAKDVFRGLVEHGFYSCPVLNKVSAKFKTRIYLSCCDKMWLPVLTSFFTSRKEMYIMDLLIC